MNTIFAGFLPLAVLSLLALMQLPPVYAIDASERESNIEKRLEFLDRFCIGICPKGPIGTDDIEDGAVTNPKLADGAVTNEKITDGAITGDKIQGVEKLIFTDCGRFEDITLEPGERHIGICDVPGIEAGDRVVTTLNPIIPRQGSFCFGVIDSEARSTDGVGGDSRVLVTFNNECVVTTTESFTFALIVYKSV
ncbi:MAG: hypothetical protein ACRD47_16220 [Nitrososphaeraceae archaeon]